MGLLGSGNIDLIKRLLDFVNDLPSRFIVSKGKTIIFISLIFIKWIYFIAGILGDQYDVPDNCWGDKMVPQMNILPKVDLVITHGGNNTVIE